MPLVTINDLLEGDPAEVDTLIGQASGLSDLYDTHIKNDLGDGHTRAAGIHASEVSGCERRIVYAVMGTERRTSNEELVWKRRFRIGHAVHAMIQKDLVNQAKNSGGLITFTEEVSIHPCLEQPLAAKWDIHSHTDGLFELRKAPDAPVHSRVLLEIKTSSPAEYEKLKSPNPDHIEQGHVYMACLDVPVIHFLYYNKGNQNYTPSSNPSFLVRFNPKVWATLEERFERAHVYAHKRQLPVRQESIKCSFCAFAWTCEPPSIKRQKGFHTPHSRWSTKP